MEYYVQNIDLVLVWHCGFKDALSTSLSSISWWYLKSVISVTQLKSYWGRIFIDVNYWSKCWHFEFFFSHIEWGFSKDAFCSFAFGNVIFKARVDQAPFLTWVMWCFLSSSEYKRENLMILITCFCYVLAYVTLRDK